MIGIHGWVEMLHSARLGSQRCTMLGLTHDTGNSQGKCQPLTIYATKCSITSCWRRIQTFLWHVFRQNWALVYIIEISISLSFKIIVKYHYISTVQLQTVTKVIDF